MPPNPHGHRAAAARGEVRLTRRGLLLAGAGGLLVAACGGTADDDLEAPETTVEDETATTTPSDAEAPAGESGGELTIPLTFLAQQPVGVEVRLPLAVADGEGAFLSDPPETVRVRVGPDGGDLGRSVTLERHDRGIPRAYYPLRTTFDETGSWRIVVDVDGTRAETVVSAVAPSDAAVVPAPGGDPLPAIPTPTRRDDQGVDPICTADPVCPLHTVSLDDALGGDRPIALLVATPAFCQTAICGPVLDLVLDEHDRVGDAVTMIHAEVFTDTTATTYTDAVRALGLPFEPALFLARPDGTVVDRLDYTFDTVELRNAIDRLVG